MKKGNLSVLVLFAFFLGVSCQVEAQRGSYLNAPEEVNKDLLLRMVNEVRARGCRCGSDRYGATDPVVWNNALEEAAQGHSNWMDKTGRFDHRGAGRSSVGDRTKDAGYAWSRVGENIAAGQTSVERVMESWLKSPGHCKNIMNPSFTEIAVATRGPYWTMVLGKPL